MLYHFLLNFTPLNYSTYYN